VVELAAYMNEAGVSDLMIKATFETLDKEFLEKFIPFLDNDSKEVIFTKILNRELDPSLLKVILPWVDYKYLSLVEAAVLDGLLDSETLTMLREI
jgi:hypothetical protein